MFQQLDYFEEYQQRVAALIGEDEARQLVDQALVLITVGGNDFVNNYYLVPFSARSLQYSLPNYVKYLISEYEKLLQVARLPPFTHTHLYYYHRMPTSKRDIDALALSNALSLSWVF
jgi:hypothetical protein